MADGRRWVLDTSALVAVFLREPGAPAVEAVLDRVVVSSVILAETLGVLMRRGVEQTLAEEWLAALDLPVVPFDAPQALIAGRLDPTAHRHGISFADRCCIALGRHLRLPVLTGDRPWAALDLGVEVRLIR